MSTSTYTPTFLSVKNWPEITWWVIGARLAPLKGKEKTPEARRTYFNFDGVGDDPVHDVFGEGVKVFVRPPHELGFQQVAAAAVVLEHAHVQLHREVWRRTTGGCVVTPKQIFEKVSITQRKESMPYRGSGSLAPPSGSQRSKRAVACSLSCPPSYLSDRFDSAGFCCT